MFLAFGLATAIAVADDDTKLPPRAPAGTVLACYSDNVAASCAAFKGTDLGAAWTGDKFLPLAVALRADDRAAPFHLRPMFGFDWSDLELVGDAGGLFVFPIDDGIGMAWIFTGAVEADGDPPDCLAKAEKYFTDKGYGRAISDHGAAKLTTYKAPKGSDRAAFVADGLYGVASSPAAAKAVLDVEAEKSLASIDIFAKAAPPLDKAPEESSIHFFVQPIGLWELIRHDNLPAGPNARDPLASAKRMGLSDIQAIRGVLDLRPDDPHQMRIQAFMLAPRLNKVDKKTFTYHMGMGLLDMVPVPMPHLPDWVAENSVSVSSWGWDFPLAMKAFGHLFDDHQMPGQGGAGLWDDTLNALMEDPEQPSIDVRADLFKRLGPEGLAVRVKDDDAKPDSLSFVYSFACRDTDKVVEKVFGPYYKGDKEIDHAKVRDHDVWTSPEGRSLLIAGEGESLATIRSLAVGGGRLQFSDSPELMASAVSGDKAKAPLVDRPLWKDYLAWLDREEGMTTAYRSLARLDALAGPGYELAHKDGVLKDDETVTSRLWRYVLFGTANRGADLPHKAVPAFAKWGDALAPSGLLLSKTDDGWIVKFSTFSAAPGAK